MSHTGPLRLEELCSRPPEQRARRAESRAQRPNPGLGLAAQQSNRDVGLSGEESGVDRRPSPMQTQVSLSVLSVSGCVVTETSWTQASQKKKCFEPLKTTHTRKKNKTAEDAMSSATFRDAKFLFVWKNPPTKIEGELWNVPQKAATQSRAHLS